MIVIGIDPGLASIGFGVLDESRGKTICLDYGCIRTRADRPFADRLKEVYDAVSELIGRYEGATCALEDLFFCKNVKTAFAVGQSRGVCILAAVQGGMDVHSYTPLQVKMAVAGYGKAPKKQVQNMVTNLLKLNKTPEDHAADALAVALCHLHSFKYLKEVEKQIAGNY